MGSFDLTKGAKLDDVSVVNEESDIVTHKIYGQLFKNTNKTNSVDKSALSFNDFILIKG